MANLKDVINQLVLNNDTVEETNSLVETQTSAIDVVGVSVQELTDTIKAQIVLMQASALDDIERQRELIAALRTPGPPGGDRNRGGRGGGDTSPSRGLFGSLTSRIVAPITDLLKMAATGLSPLLSPLKLLGRLVMRGGPLALAITALYAVFHDIGENPKLKETIDGLKALWFDRLVPTFEAIRNTFNDIVGSEGAKNLFTQIGIYWENLKTSIQNNFLSLVTIVGELVGDFADGIVQMTEGDFLGGIGTMLRGLYDAVLGTMGEGVKLILSAMGFDQAAVSETVNTITNTIKFVLDNFGLLVDILGAQFDYTFTWIENGFKKTVASIKGFFSTLGDKIYLMIAENLRFTFPTIELPLPGWAQDLGAPEKFTLIQGFEAGIDQQKIQDTRVAIGQSEAMTRAEVNRLDVETSTKLKELEDLKAQLSQNFVQQVIVANQPAVRSGGGQSAPSVMMVPVGTADVSDRRDTIRRFGPQ